MAAVALVVFIAPFASKSPDGLEKVAADKGFIEKEETAVFSAPLADYFFPYIKDKRLSTALSGVVGVVIIFGAISFFGRIFKRKNDGRM